MLNLFKLPIEKSSLEAWSKLSDDVAKVAILAMPVILYGETVFLLKVIKYCFLTCCHLLLPSCWAYFSSTIGEEIICGLQLVLAFLLSYPLLLLFLQLTQQNILNLLTPIFRGFPYLKCGDF